MKNIIPMSEELAHSTQMAEEFLKELKKQTRTNFFERIGGVFATLIFLLALGIAGWIAYGNYQNKIDPFLANTKNKLESLSSSFNEDPGCPGGRFIKIVTADKQLAIEPPLAGSLYCVPAEVKETWIMVFSNPDKVNALAMEIAMASNVSTTDSIVEEINKSVTDGTLDLRNAK